MDSSEGEWTDCCFCCQFTSERNALAFSFSKRKYETFHYRGESKISSTLRGKSAKMKSNESSILFVTRCNNIECWLQWLIPNKHCCTSRRLVRKPFEEFTPVHWWVVQFVWRCIRVCGRIRHRETHRKISSQHSNLFPDRLSAPFLSTIVWRINPQRLSA